MKKALLVFLIIFSHILYAQSDCETAIPVCGNSNISYDPKGPGNILDIPKDNVPANLCLKGGEHFSVWYSFTIGQSGTLTFEITPNVDPDGPHNDDNSADYDWAVWGPSPVCGSLASLGTPVRCNYAPRTGPWPHPTGLASPAPNGSYEAPMEVIAGQTYVLLVDNFSHNELGFSMTWGGTATLASPFNHPTLSPNPFLPPGGAGPTPSDPREVPICSIPSLYDFTTLSNNIINGNENFSVSYHRNSNDALTGDAPIITPITVNGTTTYFYRIKYTDPDDPNNALNKCFITGSFKFKDVKITAKDATVLGCNNQEEGTAEFDLTTANIFAGTGTVTKKYYPTMADLTADTNEITDPEHYISNEKIVYAKVISIFGCTATAAIRLTFHPVVKLKDAVIEECYLENNITSSAFNLTLADIGALDADVKKYYKTLEDAEEETNPILNPENHLTESTVVYVRVTNSMQCYSIAKITLTVLPPVKSAILKDKVICAEAKTTLDAGPGFDGYEWSTGETTQSINNVGIGVHWVKLKTGKCYTLQTVTVRASQQPVISSVEITNNTIKVNVTGGTPPYKYSTDGINWQDSDTFTGLPRGENKVFVKDSFNCNPIQITITVPNLINAITPNGDKINDEIDYSELAYKNNLVFIVYDRYGNKIHEADKLRGYKWDGTAFGKKILTGTYWYTISWNENDKNNTETKYSGWILVKNKE
ncbi:MAG: gliding motility-associated C-terminal domain-containing protein [Chryseobacterium sp.]|jgi:gliding motility-associated-like protein|uniref:T9SS type B sorting domain-containing protein n=1 Tax=Chryseobacterium sp. TaxID=1871047 RepID=UPI002833BEBF|nr:T9SS type B sorting domain-containing protein [Chryseobacterium sp.]MDR2236230.1 gliding motility-associated C-terminal domain-containing protein [Chryseobacterium sp.]